MDRLAILFALSFCVACGGGGATPSDGGMINVRDAGHEGDGGHAPADAADAETTDTTNVRDAESGDDVTSDAAVGDVEPDVPRGPDIELNTATISVTEPAPGFAVGETVAMTTLGAAIEERVVVAFSAAVDARSINLKLDNLNLLPGSYGCVLDASPPVEEIMVTLRSSDGTDTQRYVARDGIGRCRLDYVIADEIYAGTLSATLVDDVRGIEMIDVEVEFRFARE